MNLFVSFVIFRCEIKSFHVMLIKYLLNVTFLIIYNKNATQQAIRPLEFGGILSTLEHQKEILYRHFQFRLVQRAVN